MSSSKSFWYRLGFALERARHLPSAGTGRLAGLRERAEERVARRQAARRTPRTHVDDAVTAGAVALAARALDAWHPRKRAGLVALLKGGASGAAAALVVELVRPLLDGRGGVGPLDEDAAARLVRGAGQGIVYGAAAERWIPGPPLLKGALYGSAEYVADGMGGLSRLLGRHTPLGRVPPLLTLLDGLDGEDRDFLEHVAFGVALALLYGESAPHANGSGAGGDPGED